MAGSRGGCSLNELNGCSCNGLLAIGLLIGLGALGHWDRTTCTRTSSRTDDRGATNPSAEMNVDGMPLQYWIAEAASLQLPIGTTKQDIDNGKVVVMHLNGDTLDNTDENLKYVLAAEHPGLQ